jgi:hypothetical protein
MCACEQVCSVQYCNQTLSTTFSPNLYSAMHISLSKLYLISTASRSNTTFDTSHSALEKQRAELSQEHVSADVWMICIGVGVSGCLHACSLRVFVGSKRSECVVNSPQRPKFHRLNSFIIQAQLATRLLQLQTQLQNPDLMANLYASSNKQHYGSLSSHALATAGNKRFILSQFLDVWALLRAQTKPNVLSALYSRDRGRLYIPR